MPTCTGVTVGSLMPAIGSGVLPMQLVVCRPQLPGISQAGTE
jgi:hypothetical protein